MGLHPVIRAAGRGRLPEWAAANARRRAHMERVSALLRQWAEVRGEGPDELLRWASMGHLHDALWDAEPGELRDLLPEPVRELPDRLLHGPAAAERLRLDGVEDDELLQAVAYHTLGHPDFGDLGKSLYAADFLEPGRRFRREWRAEIRKRMPWDIDPVVREILCARIRHLIDQFRPVRPETMGFWNAMVEGQPWAAASEV